MQKTLPDYFWADKLKPIRFYRYPSFTRDVFYEINVAENKDERDTICRFHDLKRRCMDSYVDMKMSGEDPMWTKDVWDNKIVIECLTESGNIIFVGFHDFIYSVGEGVVNYYEKGRPYKGD